MFKILNTRFSYLKVLQPGISSIQDAGRFGYLAEGVPMAGFMDATAAGLANMLVGNSVDYSCIEWAMLPPKLEFKNAAVIALTGAIVKVFLDNKEISMYKSINVPKNGVISFGHVKNGVYGYIAIQKGFQTEKILGSRSWFSQITLNNLFIKGMEIPFFNQSIPTVSKTRIAQKKKNQSTLVLDVYPGPEFYLLTKKEQLLLLNLEFTVSTNRNRMGVQFSEAFESHDFSILSSPVLPGTVQWTPSGKLIILLKDAQTIGGYPRILQLTENALVRLVNHNSTVYFNIIL